MTRDICFADDVTRAMRARGIIVLFNPTNWSKISRIKKK